MSIRFGYACLNITLGPKQGGFRSMIRKTFQSKGLEHASSLTHENVETLCGIIQWNNNHGIKVYRMTSGIAPWASEYELSHLPDWSSIRAGLELAGKLARDGGQRLSFHPGQFNCLTSPREHVVLNCIRDLRIHGEIMDVMGMPNTPESKINIHLGGAFGQKEESMDRWCRNFERVPDSVKSRLTVENDDKANCYSVVDLHKVSQRVGVPIVLDYHHHKFCDGGLTERDALHLAASTWPEGIRPCTHYSESAALREGRDVSAVAHSNFVDGPVDSHGLEIDCVVEAKAKELAVIQLVTGKNMSQFYDEQRGMTDEDVNEAARKDKEKKAAARAAKKSAA
jgi:UV DNA damage endonuclease